jgi:hypothetical protein
MLTTIVDHNDIRLRPMESDGGKPRSQVNDSSRQGAGSLQAEDQAKCGNRWARWCDAEWILAVNRRTILHSRSHEPNTGSGGRSAARPKSQNGCCVFFTDTNAPIQLRATALGSGSADGAMCLPGGSTKTAQ